MHTYYTMNTIVYIFFFTQFTRSHKRDNFIIIFFLNFIYKPLKIHKFKCEVCFRMFDLSRFSTSCIWFFHLFMSLFKCILTLHSICLCFSTSHTNTDDDVRHCGRSSISWDLPVNQALLITLAWVEVKSSQSLSNEFKLHFPVIHLHSDIIKNLTSKQTWNLKSNIQKECTHTDHLQCPGSKQMKKAD